MDALDAFAALSDTDKEELRRLHVGARFTGSARDQLAEFTEAHGWSDDVLNKVLRCMTVDLLENRSKHAKMGSIKPCNVCGRNAIGVTDEGFRCEEHWVTPQPLDGAASPEPM